MNLRTPLTLLAAMLALACSRQEMAPADDAREHPDSRAGPASGDEMHEPPPASLPPAEEVGPDTAPHMVPNEVTPAPESPPPTD